MSEFSGSGFETFPSLHADTAKITVFAEMDTEILERLANEYTDFLARGNLMPRAEKTANRILDHVLFEMAYRDGIYDEYLNLEEVTNE